MSGQLAKAYLIASTANTAETPVTSWALGGMPMMVAEYGPGDLLLPPAGAQPVPNTIEPGVTIHHYWLRPGAGVERSCWLLYSRTDALTSVRHLRICLAQLHAQRSCLELALHSIAAGKLAPPRGSTAHAALQAYLDSTRRSLSRVRARSTSFGAGFLEAAEAAFEHINPFTPQLLKKLDEALHHLGLRYTTVKGAMKEVAGTDAGHRTARPNPDVDQLGAPIEKVPPTPKRVTRMAAKIDVLIVAALEDERDAVLSYRDGVIEEWRPLKGPQGFNYHLATFKTLGPQARELTVAVARLIRMGELYTANLATRLMSLSPSMLAMTGICAGDRRQTNLGDVIVADRVFKFDYGKLKAAVTATGQRQQDIFHDLITYHPRAQLIEAVQELEGLWRRELSRARPLSYSAQERWLLRTLAQEGMEGTLQRPDRRTRCPSWEKILKRLKQVSHPSEPLPMYRRTPISFGASACWKGKPWASRWRVPRLELWPIWKRCKCSWSKPSRTMGTTTKMTNSGCMRLKLRLGFFSTCYDSIGRTLPPVGQWPPEKRTADTQSWAPSGRALSPRSRAPRGR